MSAEYSVAGDWGTTRLRLFRLVDGRVVDRAEGPGIGASAEPASTLRAVLAPWRADGDPDRIVLCGMAGARGGLAEAPYADCPADAGMWVVRAQRLDIDGIPVAIAAGLACGHADGTPDVMRGEETQVFGAMREHPALARGAHLIALPGTHGKWVSVADGVVLSFRTFPTGELFALLRDHSTLARAGDDLAGGDEGFDDGLAAARAAGGVLGKLFRARGATLRLGRSRGWARGYLSGLLIGSEVVEMLASAAAAGTVTLVGDPALTARYSRALEPHDVDVRVLDGDDCVLAGLHLFEEACR